MLGWSILLTVTVMLAVVCHWRIPSFGWAVAATVLASPAVTLGIFMLLDGRLDPFTIIATLMSVGIMIPIAWLVGTVFRRARQRR